VPRAYINNQKKLCTFIPASESKSSGGKGYKEELGETDSWHRRVINGIVNQRNNAKFNQGPAKKLPEKQARFTLRVPKGGRAGKKK